MLKFITSITIIVLSFVLLIEVPSIFALDAMSKYRMLNQKTIEEFTPNNPILIEGEQGRLLQGKSIKEQNKLHKIWFDDLLKHQAKKNDYDKKIRFESLKVYDEYHMPYSGFFTGLIITLFGLIGYFVKFYNKLDILYLSIPFAFVSFVHTTTSHFLGTSLVWFMALIIVYLLSVHLKKKMK